MTCLVVRAPEQLHVKAELEALERENAPLDRQRAAIGAAKALLSSFQVQNHWGGELDGTMSDCLS